MSNHHNVGRITITGCSPAERQAIKDAAKADDRPVTVWARHILLRAAAEAGFHPVSQPHPDQLALPFEADD